MATDSVDQRGSRSSKSAALGPLPGGHHGLTREQIIESQRERLLAAIVARVAADGYRETKISEVVREASVSTRDFYELFDGKEDCFSAAFEVVYRHLQNLIKEAAAAEADWPRKVIAGLRAGLDFFAVEADLARVCLLEAVSATPAIATRYRTAVLAGAPTLVAGRAEMDISTELLPGTEDAILGGIVSSVTHQLIAKGAGDLPRLLPGLVNFALVPYLGPERASKLAREVVPSGESSA